MTADSRTPTKKKQLLELAVTKRTGKPLRQCWRCVFHPLKPEDHPEQIVNVANGILGASLVNVDQVVSIGRSQLLYFEKELPTGFWKSIEGKVKTMAAAKKGIAIGPKILFDTELIFSRVIGLQASSSLHQSQLPYSMTQVRPIIILKQYTLII